MKGNIYRRWNLKRLKWPQKIFKKLDRVVKACFKAIFRGPFISSLFFFLFLLFFQHSWRQILTGWRQKCHEKDSPWILWCHFGSDCSKGHNHQDKISGILLCHWCLHHRLFHACWITQRCRNCQETLQKTFQPEFGAYRGFGTGSEIALKYAHCWFLFFSFNPPFFWFYVNNSKQLL